MISFQLRLLFIVIAVLFPVTPFADTGILFIVNRQNPVTSVSLRDVLDYYFKKNRQWPDDVPVRFIDRNSASPERQAFLNRYLRKSSSDVDLYWFGQKLHTGDSVPIQVGSDSMVVQLVKSFRGGIGYISASAPINDKLIKIIKITGMTQE